MIGQTITVVNKSGKVVSTSKHLVNVFKEAKSAYLDKKAELKAAREVPASDRRPQATPAQGAVYVDYRDHGSRSSSHHSNSSSRQHSSHSHSSRHRHGHSHSGSRSGSGRRHSKPTVERGYSDSFYAGDHPHSTRPSRTQPPSPLRFMHEAENEAFGKELVRRHSTSELGASSASAHGRRHSALQYESDEGHDPDLAYGELPPPLPSRDGALATESELKVKMTALQRMLEEANCVQHSATAIVKNLEKNPDAMAAVALTLAEISNLAAKMAPGALVALKGAFPAVIALLVSPEFLIAAGVGVGLTVVCLGGYKIVKKIKRKKELDRESSEEEAEEAEEELGCIESWRQGIADVEVRSVGTSVEGELITPEAARQLREQGLMPTAPMKKSATVKDGKSKSVKKSDKHSKHKDLVTREDSVTARERALKDEEEDLKSKERELTKQSKAQVAETKKAEAETKKKEKEAKKASDKAEKEAKAKDQKERKEKDAKQRRERGEKEPSASVVASNAASAAGSQLMMLLNRKGDRSQSRESARGKESEREADKAMDEQRSMAM